MPVFVKKRIAVETPERGVLTLTAAPAARIGELAAAHGIVLHELTTIKASLEDAYLELTGGTEPAYRPANFVSGYESLPVTFTPTAPVG